MHLLFILNYQPIIARYLSNISEGGDLFLISSQVGSEKYILLGWLSTHDSAHAKIKKPIFNRKILEFVGDIGIILNDFQNWF